MAEETPQAPEQTPAPSTPVSNEPQTLDDVYKTFNVEEAVQEFKAAPQSAPQAPAPQAPAAPSIPDPVLDPAGYRTWQTANAHETQNLRQALQNVQGQLNNFQAAIVRQKEEADIKQAIDTVNSNLDQKLDPDTVEIALGVRARKDPKFMAVYQNRHRNANAWNAALKVVAKELGTKYAMRTDPQIAENVRALKDATSGKATADNPAPNSLAEKLEKASGADFDRLWRQARGGMQ